MKSSHAIGYHAFELAYLAHLYTRAYRRGGRRQRQQLLPVLQDLQHQAAEVDQRAAGLHAAGSRAHHLGARQRHRRDRGSGSGQSRRIPDPDGRDDRPIRRTGRSNSSSSSTRPRCRRKPTAVQEATMTDTVAGRQEDRRYRRKPVHPGRDQDLSGALRLLRRDRRSGVAAVGPAVSSAFTAPSSRAVVEPARVARGHQGLRRGQRRRLCRGDRCRQLHDRAAALLASGRSPPATPPRWRATYPAARFFRRAMENPKIIKGAPATRCGC